MGSAIAGFEGARAMRVPRTRFAPVKTTDDLLALWSDAYTLTDRATWVAFGNKGDHGIVVEGAPELLNPYGVIVVSPEACPDTNIADAETLRDWLLSPAGKAAINGFVVDGQQLFFAAP